MFVGWRTGEGGEIFLFEGRNIEWAQPTLMQFKPKVIPPNIMLTHPFQRTPSFDHIQTHGFCVQVKFWVIVLSMDKKASDAYLLC